MCQKEFEEKKEISKNRRKRFRKSEERDFGKQKKEISENRRKRSSTRRVVEAGGAEADSSIVLIFRKASFWSSESNRLDQERLKSIVFIYFQLSNRRKRFRKEISEIRRKRKPKTREKREREIFGTGQGRREKE